MIIERIVNQPVPSNSFVIIEGRHCIIVDPGSRFVDSYVNYLANAHLILDYIFLTHEHFDHIWSADELKNKYGAKIVCAKRCAETIAIPRNYFNMMYYDDASFFSINDVDIILGDDESFTWEGHGFRFIYTPGHSSSSYCICSEGILFSGDTILHKMKPYINKRYGGRLTDLKISLTVIFSKLPDDTFVYPGHGDGFELGEVRGYYSKIMCIGG